MFSSDIELELKVIDKDLFSLPNVDLTLSLGESYLLVFDVELKRDFED